MTDKGNNALRIIQDSCCEKAGGSVAPEKYKEFSDKLEREIKGLVKEQIRKKNGNKEI